MILGGSGSGSFLISTEGISAKIVREPFKIWMAPACISIANTGAEKFIFGSKDSHKDCGSEKVRLRLRTTALCPETGPKTRRGLSVQDMSFIPDIKPSVSTYSYFFLFNKWTDMDTEK